MKKVGLFFGSFNPIHIGHTALAAYIAEQGLVDELWFVVSPHNPLKEKDGLMNAELRLKMVQTAIDGYEKFCACDVEFSLPQPSYTIDTLRYLCKKYTDKQFSVIMGADSLADIEKWKDYEEILAEYDLIVYPRTAPSKPPKSPSRGTWLAQDFIQNSQTSKTSTVAKVPLEGDLGGFELEGAPLLDISATFIREQLAQGCDVRYFVPNGVGEIIKSSMSNPKMPINF